jgi:hypothetical protein
MFASYDVSEMQNRYRVHIGNAHIKLTHRWIANIIVSLVISGDFGDVPWSEHWRNCVHDQETLTRMLLIFITVEMVDNISFMPDGKYWADCRLNGDSWPFLEIKKFRILLNNHWWDLFNTILHCLHCLHYIAHRMSGSRLPYRLKYRRCNFFCHIAHLLEMRVSASPASPETNHTMLSSPAPVTNSGGGGEEVCF